MWQSRRSDVQLQFVLIYTPIEYKKRGQCIMTESCLCVQMSSSLHIHLLHTVCICPGSVYICNMCGWVGETI